MTNVLALALGKGHPTMIKDLSLTGEVDSKVMGGVHGGFSGILSCFYFRARGRQRVNDEMQMTRARTIALLLATLNISRSRIARS